MALYVGSNKKKIYIGDTFLITPRLSSSIPILSGVVLKSSDSFVLKDKNGLYLTAKESE